MKKIILLVITTLGFVTISKTAYLSVGFLGNPRSRRLIQGGAGNPSSLSELRRLRLERQNKAASGQRVAEQGSCATVVTQKRVQKQPERDQEEIKAKYFTFSEEDKEKGYISKRDAASRDDYFDQWVNQKVVNILEEDDQALINGVKNLKARRAQKKAK